MAETKPHGSKPLRIWGIATVRSGTPKAFADRLIQRSVVGLLAALGIAFVVAFLDALDRVLFRPVGWVIRYALSLPPWALAAAGVVGLLVTWASVGTEKMRAGAILALAYLLMFVPVAAICWWLGTF